MTKPRIESALLHLADSLIQVKKARDVLGKLSMDDFFAFEQAELRISACIESLKRTLVEISQAD